MSGSNPIRGAACAIAASLMMAIMGAAIRLASAQLANEMVVFLRNAFGLLVLLPWIYRHGWGALATSRLSSHLLRSLAGLATM
jgi:drug/metabolite transporter (DMT)-like permease